MIFCDLSTPKDDGTFSVYDDIQKLLELGIPENEIAFIHNAKSEAKKKELFGKVRARSGACPAGQHPAQNGCGYQRPG